MKFVLMAVIAVTSAAEWTVNTHENGYKVSGDPAQHAKKKRHEEMQDKVLSVKEILKKFDSDKDGIVSHDEAEKKFDKYCRRFAMKSKNYMKDVKIKKQDRPHVLAEAHDLCQDEFNMWWHDVDPQGEGFINEKALREKGPLEFTLHYEKLVA